MEELKYIIDDNTIIELLGVQNFTNKESAILELVKNAFDAKATQLTIKITKTSITLIDNGSGMNKDDFLSSWMHIGKSNKGYQIKDENGNVRILAGSKGIGRFALARLGRSVNMYSKKSNSDAIRWTTDWRNIRLENEKSEESNGTFFFINNLRDTWTKNETEKLVNYLCRTYNDTVMTISLYFENTFIPISNCFQNPRLGYNYVSEINLQYNSSAQKLQVDIKSDEFLDSAKKYYKQNDLNKYNKVIDLNSELKSNAHFFDKDMSTLLLNLGDFSSRLFFSRNRSVTDDEEKFLYKHSNLEHRYDTGIILYRNSFSISSFDGDRDWLELSKRARKSPAAATHPTGAWRVRENQISGMVLIDKKNNTNLRDLANRQGLDENDYYKLFIEIITIGIAEFERYRQNIIRAINKKNKDINAQNEIQISKEIIKNPQIISTLSSKDKTKLVNELKQDEKEKKEYQQKIEENEKRYKYDVRILNILASSGLRATSIAHDLKNDRNTLADNYEYIVNALKKYDLWDELNEEDKKKDFYMDVPMLLLKNKKVGTKILQFMNSMLEEVEKRQFIPELYNIKTILNNIVIRWERDYSWIKINIDIDEELEYMIPEDVINVIFDNLILNTVQQNADSNSLDIAISAQKKDKFLLFSYQDKGIGLKKEEKYINNPRRILEPHETSRPEGHGLGMWIVNNTLDMTGGEVIDIKGDEGFFISFSIGDKI